MYIYAMIRTHTYWMTYKEYKKWSKHSKNNSNQNSVQTRVHIYFS